MGKIKLFYLAFLILGGCITVPSVVEKEKAAISDDSPRYLRYIVQRGDTYWKIAQMAYNDSRKWPTIFKANGGRIKDVKDLKPGEIIIIPIEE